MVDRCIQPRRGCESKPRVGPLWGLPWVTVRSAFQPQRGCAICRPKSCHTDIEMWPTSNEALGHFRRNPQGRSSFRLPLRCSLLTDHCGYARRSSPRGSRKSLAANCKLFGKHDTSTGDYQGRWACCPGGPARVVENQSKIYFEAWAGAADVGRTAAGVARPAIAWRAPR